MNQCTHELCIENGLSVKDYLSMEFTLSTFVLALKYGYCFCFHVYVRQMGL